MHWHPSAVTRCLWARPSASVPLVLAGAWGHLQPSKGLVYNLQQLPLNTGSSCFSWKCLFLLFFFFLKKKKMSSVKEIYIWDLKKLYIFHKSRNALINFRMFSLKSVYKLLLIVMCLKCFSQLGNWANNSPHSDYLELIFASESSRRWQRKNTLYLTLKGNFIFALPLDILTRGKWYWEHL